MDHAGANPETIKITKKLLISNPTIRVSSPDVQPDKVDTTTFFLKVLKRGRYKMP